MEQGSCNASTLGNMGACLLYFCDSFPLSVGLGRISVCTRTVVMAAVNAKGMAGVLGGKAGICGNKLHVIGHAAFCFAGSSTQSLYLKHSGQVPVMLLMQLTSHYAGGAPCPTAAKLCSICHPSGPQELPGLKLADSGDLGEGGKLGFNQKRCATSALYTRRGTEAVFSAPGQAAASA